MTLNIKNLVQPLRTYKNIKKSEVILLSYPKAGRTWLRAMIGRAYWQKYSLEITWKDVTHVQYFYKKHDKVPRWTICHYPDPQFKHYEKIRFNQRLLRDKKIIFLVRNPFDVTKSFYRQYWFRGDKNLQLGKLFSNDIRQFAESEKGGVKSVIAYHLLISDYVLANSNALIIRYEDLLSNGLSELKKLTDFLDISLNDDSLNDILNDCTKDNLTSLQKLGMLDSYHFGGSGKNAKIFLGDDSDQWKVTFDSLRNLLDKDPFYKQA